ncbi:alpha/beta hydrolase [Bradyrhizobium erythrophlei]|uniref:alpha/beta hydrolase n=1 Tax=Bradyrhizobium erythrophlei TaxID=1437360 RepID=UPI0035EF2AA8
MHIRRTLAASAMLALTWITTSGASADETERHRKPVKEIAGARIAVGTAIFPLYVSADWSHPLPEITRAILVLHGVLRDADNYFESARRAQAAAGEVGRSALMIAPQFLIESDVDAFKLPADTLRWSLYGWQGGEPAIGPGPASSFDALDAILARLGDRRLLPNLKQVVVFGHSGGAQVVQRYAIAAKGDQVLLREGIDVRYVIANPSSYAYFSADRPEPAIAAHCDGFNRWKFGMEDRPPYLAAPTAAALEQAYVARRVIYLLGTLDTDPNHPALDKSCMAEAEGPYRYARGHAYVAAMQARDNGTPNHSVWDVPGVGHQGGKMLTSPCGLTALFDIPGCEAAR